MSVGRVAASTSWVQSFVVTCTGWSLAWLGILTALSLGCAHIYSDAQPPEKPALLAARVHTDRYAITVAGAMRLTGASMRTCSAADLKFPDDADFVELRAGRHHLQVKLLGKDIVRPDIPIEGQVELAAAGCYLPAIACDGDVYDALYCRVVVKPSPCPSPWLPRRLPAHGVRHCQAPGSSPSGDYGLDRTAAAPLIDAASSNTFARVTVST